MSNKENLNLKDEDDSPSAAAGSTTEPIAVPWDDPNIDPVKDIVTPETWRLCRMMGMIPSHINSYEEAMKHLGREL